MKDKHGRCPLHCAALFANVEAVKTLIKANANPDQEWKLQFFIRPVYRELLVVSFDS